MKKRYHILVRGRVQGVGFRAFTKMSADNLEITGWVRNVGDGETVEMEIQGERLSVYDLIEAVRQGPTFGRVDHFQETPLALRDEEEGFEIRV
ncbi:MAG: acylphosphatase [Lentisphaeria bacterium]|nr:acylphosphatase [Lentisphaeria bacterium]